MPEQVTRLPLTDRQREVYDFLRAHLVRHQRLPAVREISDHFGMGAARTGAHCHLVALARKGWIVRRGCWYRLAGVRVELHDEPPTEGENRP